MKQQGDYALELATPVGHVATMIGDAAPAAISVKEIAAPYKGHSGDTHRVRVNEKLGSDTEAIEWLEHYDASALLVASDGDIRITPDWHHAVHLAA